MECSFVLPITQLAYQKGDAPVMHFCACPIRCRVHWRVDRRQRLERLTLFQPLIQLTLGNFYKPCSVGTGGSVFYVFYLYSMYYIYAVSI